MYFIEGLRSLVAFIGIGVAASAFLALKRPSASLPKIALSVSTWSALVYVLVYSIIIQKIAPLILIGYAGAFATYLPLAFATSLATRLIVRRKLQVLPDGATKRNSAH